VSAAIGESNNETTPPGSEQEKYACCEQVADTAELVKNLILEHCRPAEYFERVLMSMR
jgi:hypothetical protein